MILLKAVGTSLVALFVAKARTVTLLLPPFLLVATVSGQNHMEVYKYYRVKFCMLTDCIHIAELQISSGV